MICCSHLFTIPTISGHFMTSFIMFLVWISKWYRRDPWSEISEIENRRRWYTLMIYIPMGIHEHYRFLIFHDHCINCINHEMQRVPYFEALGRVAMMISDEAKGCLGNRGFERIEPNICGFLLRFPVKSCKYSNKNKPKICLIEPY